MDIIHKIAKPCGIVGGIWGLLAPLLVYAPIYMRGAEPQVGAPQQEPEEDMAEMGMAGEVLPILIFIALMALLGLLAIVLYQARPRMGRIFIWVSASAILAISLVSIFSLGLYFLPASVLLLLAAVGLREDKQSLVKEAK